jgi:hypothetical protein
LILLAKWAYQDIKEHVEKKFNQKGFILCKQHCKESFEHIRFGQSITVDIFLNGIRSGNIFLDSGMHANTSRNYSAFRAKGQFLDALIIS